MSSLCSFNHPITLSSKRGSSSSKINDGFFSRSLFSEVLIVLVLKLVIIKGKRPSTGSAYCTEKALLLLLWSCHIMVFWCRKKKQRKSLLSNTHPKAQCVKIPEKSHFHFLAWKVWIFVHCEWGNTEYPGAPFLLLPGIYIEQSSTKS